MKLFVFDVDGTLITQQGIKPQTVKAINERLANGDVIAIASGRPFLGIKKYLDRFIDGKKFAIASNGAAIYDMEQNVLSVTPIKFKDFRLFHEKFSYLIEKENASIYCYTYDSVGYYKFTRPTLYEGNCNGHIKLQNLNKEPIKDSENILKIMVVCDSKVYNKLNLDEEKTKFHLVNSSPIYHEILNKKVDKAAGVEFLRKKYKLDKKDCYCFGDEMNDYLMIKNYNGVAMDNALEEVKKVAKIHTKSAKQAGVAYALNNLIPK